MYDIITFGSATEDVFMSSRELKLVEGEQFITKKGLCVSLGSKMHMDDVFFAMGGCGTNTAVTFARQGLKTAYFGSIGRDCSGQIVKNELSKQGVSLDLLRETEQWPTAYSVILSLPEVGRSILEKYGACHQLTEQEIPFDKLKAKWFYVASLSDKSHGLLTPLIDFAKKQGIKVAANPSGSVKKAEHIEILKRVLDKIDILILNQEEAGKLTGLDYQKEKEIFKRLDDWVRGIVVMTKGPKGVTVSDGKNLYSAGIPKSGLVDRTGAGDAFGSGLVAGYIEKGDIGYAIQLGTANATACLQQLGATNGLLKKDDWGEWEKVEIKKEAI